MLTSASSPGRLIHVNIGEVQIAYAPDQLRATLGSCVGLALYAAKRQVFGLAHILLPEDPERRRSLFDTRFGDVALRVLMSKMRLSEGTLEGVIAAIAGGAYMFREGKRHQDIGIKNVETARRHLDRLGIAIVAEDVGGTKARSMLVDCGRRRVETSLMTHGPEGPRRLAGLDRPFGETGCADGDSKQPKRQRQP